MSVDGTTRRIRMVVEYDGTGRRGFQKQPGQRTIQGDLEGALEAVCGHPVAVVGAGRTDAGVHALGQVVHFDTTGRIPTGRIAEALHSRPGLSLAVRCVEETGREFHARFSALWRLYHYYLSREQPSPFAARYVLRDRRLRPDARERMEEALGALGGTRDYGAFGEAPAGENTVRTVLGAALSSRGKVLRVEIAADAFLRGMVRSVVGLLLEIGRGRFEPEVMGEALAGERPRCAVKAPPRGLFLARVGYRDGYPGVDERGQAPWFETEWIGIGYVERFDENVHGKAGAGGAGLARGGCRGPADRPGGRGGGPPAAR